MPRPIPVTCFILFLLVTKAFSQTSNEGIWLPTRGSLNILVVYAEVLSDPNYYGNGNAEWQPGQMPHHPEKYFDNINSLTSNGYVSNYYNAASHGALKLKGTFWPELIQIEQSKAAYNNGTVVANILNEKFSHQPTVLRSLSELDRWTPQSNFLPKLNQPDSLIDVVIVIWRVNSKISDKNNSGYCASSNQSISLLGYKGMNCLSEFQSWDNSAVITLRHELAHAIYGGNNFHTGGAGAGVHTFIPSVSGFSMLSSWDCHSLGFNGWDRDRLNWKNPNKKFVTSAYKITSKGLIETAFEQNKSPTFTNSKYLIRNFLTSGDAVCLRLPGPDSPRLHQYLWVEQHIDTSEFDYRDTTRHGTYVYVQVGKDDKKNVYNNALASPGNYTYPLPASGRWDYLYYRDSTEKNLGNVIHRLSHQPNPVSGNHLLMRPVIDENKDGTLDKQFLPDSYIVDSGEPFRGYTSFGNATDAFKSPTQARINTSTNPSTHTLITYNYPSHRKSIYDSDTAYITGLDIRIKDTLASINGIKERCALVDVKWNQYNVSNDVRWCGTIAFKKFSSASSLGDTRKLTVDSGATLLLDRSFTPMQHKVNETDTVDGQLYFSPLTSFTLHKGTQLVLKKGATLKLTNGSNVYVRKGASIVFERGSTLKAENGSIVYLEN